MPVNQIQYVVNYIASMEYLIRGFLKSGTTNPLLLMWTVYYQ